MECVRLSYFFFNDTATTEIYTLSLHDALPISSAPRSASGPSATPMTLTGRSGSASLRSVSSSSSSPTPRESSFVPSVTISTLFTAVGSKSERAARTASRVVSYRPVPPGLSRSGMVSSLLVEQVALHAAVDLRLERPRRHRLGPVPVPLQLGGEEPQAEGEVARHQRQRALGGVPGERGAGAVAGRGLHGGGDVEDGEDPGRRGQLRELSEQRLHLGGVELQGLRGGLADPRRPGAGRRGAVGVAETGR